MQLLRQPDAQPYEIVRLPENPLRHLTHCRSFLCVLTKILCVKYAVTPLNGNAGGNIGTAYKSMHKQHGTLAMRSASSQSFVYCIYKFIFATSARILWSVAYSSQKRNFPTLPNTNILAILCLFACRLIGSAHSILSNYVIIVIMSHFFGRPRYLAIDYLGLVSIYFNFLKILRASGIRPPSPVQPLYSVRRNTAPYPPATNFQYSAHV